MKLSPDKQGDADRLWKDQRGSGGFDPPTIRTRNWGIRGMVGDELQLGYKVET
jgi:hypothetical protein